ncbi:MAG: alanine--tRNA ligase [Candidatus Omnitrophica bacterium]|nr:alanine--tRNA ligase [Candidatus Omnitrophota bacterium]
MKSLTTNELRRKYLEFFQKMGHRLFSSDTLVPDDPTVLFTSAGMNQFKPYFLGEKKDTKRAVSCQKCFRTGDLDEVGNTPFHHTFFEMLGNFSFGDYFKKEAIAFAWEFLTKELGMKEDSLWVSVYKDDKEAYDIWLKDVGISKERIIKLGEKDNFWPANAPALGPNGPCGPCSEIFFDRGTEQGCKKEDCSLACGCERFVEVWNLVFTQFNRVGENELKPLPQKNIDTGMGLERMAAVLQGKYSNFEIDILTPVVAKVRKILKVNGADNLINAIVDHTRAAVFAINDGVYPSNEERGYVIRKVIRKAAYSAHLLGRKEAFSHQLVDDFAQLMQDPYPELKEKASIIAKVIKAEEEKFLSTLQDGEAQFSVIAENLKKDDTVSAEDLFKLYDTYGFPLELSKELAKKYNLTLDESGFDRLLKQQQQRSRKKSQFSESVFVVDCESEKAIKEKITEFVGYDTFTCKSAIVLLRQDDQNVKQLKEEDKGMIILQSTPFYAESGGQLSDQGVIKGASGEFVVECVVKMGEAIIHVGKVTQGQINSGEEVEVRVRDSRRRALARAHTATHIMQAALRVILGSHVVQQGSLVDEDRLRFDFTHFQALTKDELKKIEHLVNEYVLDGMQVSKRLMTLDEAKKEGALAFFKDKYQDTVRMVSVGEVSCELCGGTHIDNSSEIGLFLVESESSISSGVRRIEAVVGKKAYNLLTQIKEGINVSAAMLKCDYSDLPGAIDNLRQDIKKKSDTINSLKKNQALGQVDDILKHKKDVCTVPTLIYRMDGAEKEDLLCVCDALRKKGTLFIFMVASTNGKNTFLCTATEDLIKKKVSCKKFVTKHGEALTLKGGGRDHLVGGVVGCMGDDFLIKVDKEIKEFLKICA